MPSETRKIESHVRTHTHIHRYTHTHTKCITHKKESHVRTNTHIHKYTHTYKMYNLQDRITCPHTYTHTQIYAHTYKMYNPQHRITCPHTYTHTQTYTHTYKMYNLQDRIRPDSILGFSLSKSWVEMCCSVLQCVAVCCSVLQCVAVCCSVRYWFFSPILFCGFDWAHSWVEIGYDDHNERPREGTHWPCRLRVLEYQDQPYLSRLFGFSRESLCCGSHLVFH